jgi:hypothetical protein
MHCQPVPGTVSDICDRPRSPTLQIMLISRNIIHTSVYISQVKRCTPSLEQCSSNFLMRCHSMIYSNLTSQNNYYCISAKLCVSK